MNDSKNTCQKNQELEESWDWNNPKKFSSPKPSAANMFLSDDDNDAPKDNSSKHQVNNGFMLSDEEPSNNSPKLNNLGGFLSDDEPTPSSPKPKSKKKRTFGGLMSSNSCASFDQNNLYSDDPKSEKDSMEDIFLGNRKGKDQKEEDNEMDFIIESKFEDKPNPISIGNSEILSPKKEKNPYNLEFVRAKTLLESKLSPTKANFKPEETPCLLLQTIDFKDKILNEKKKDYLRLKLEKVRKEVKSMEAVSCVQIKLELAKDITAQLIELFIMESKSEGGPSELDLQTHCKQILNEMRFGLPSLDKQLESPSFSRLLEQKFFFGEQEKYRLAFGTRFSQKKQIKELIISFFKFNHLKSCLKEKEINRPVQHKNKLKKTVLETLIKRDLMKVKAKGKKIFLEYILRNLGVDHKSKKFSSLKEKYNYVKKLVISKIQSTKEPSKGILKIVLEILKEK
jgi:hypothetical protein